MRSRALPVLAAALLTSGATACGADETPAAPATPTAPASSAPADADARAELAGRAALAEDHAFTAVYTYRAQGAEPRSIMATVAADGSWRVDIPTGILGGTTDVAVAETEAGLFQCAVPSATNPITASCVRAGDRGEQLPAKNDPKVERLFRQWLTVFTDRQAALSVTKALPLEGSTGDCYSVDTISASLAAPVDIGIYCYATDGLLTAARVGFGTLTLAGEPAAAPQSIDLPGPVTSGDLLGLDAPPTTAAPTAPSSSAAYPAPSAAAG